MKHLQMRSLAVNLFTVRRGDIIAIRGQHRIVRDMRTVGPYSKLLILDNGTTHSLGRQDIVNALRPERSIQG